MGTENLSPAEVELIRQVVEAVERAGSIRGAATDLNLPYSTVRDRWMRARREGMLGEGRDEAAVSPGFTLPRFPGREVDTETVLNYLDQNFAAEREHRQALHWFKIAITTPGPIAICWFGDPHLGSPGCNVPTLRRDIAAVAGEEACFAVNIGDTVDNWGGRLTRLYADTTATRAIERQLARWFLQEAGIKWLAWLVGNHDTMDGALTAYLDGINAAVVPMVDWRARFRLVFPGGEEVRVDAAHDHKGSSIWNPLHGQVRASVMDEPADLYVAGDHHVFALATNELPGARVVNLVRVRGYKFNDEYARRNGFPEQQYGCSVVTVIDPAAPPSMRIMTFPDVVEGIKYLRWRRG